MDIIILYSLCFFSQKSALQKLLHFITKLNFVSFSKNILDDLRFKSEKNHILSKRI